MIFRLFVIKELKRFPLFSILLVFIICLGISGILGMEFLSHAIRGKLEESGNNFLTSDLVVSARRNITENEKRLLNSFFEKIPHKSYQVVDIYSMVRRLSTNEAKLVELRGIERGYPFYGKVITSLGTFNTFDFYATQALATALKLNLNEKFKVGEVEITIKDLVIEDQSIGFRGFSLAPRIFLPLDVLTKSKLINFGSTGNFSIHYKLDNTDRLYLEELRKKIYKLIPDPSLKVTLANDSSMQTGRLLETLGNYLSLSALVGFVLALVGVFYLYQSQILVRLKDYSLLNLYGLSFANLTLGLVMQIALLFFIGALFSTGLVSSAFKLFENNLSELLGMKLAAVLDYHPFMTNSLFLF